MTRDERLRRVVNWINLTTLLGLLVARAGGGEVKPGPGGLLVAGDYKLAVPQQQCFTIGNVVNSHRPADWLLDPERTELLGHESGHATQYAWTGVFFFPLYGLASAWSWLLTGGYGARNIFERKAGLATGGYADRPLRPWASRLGTFFGPR
ncbi:MAG: hypothetical protein ACRDTM_13180 [Micromonosporaceae bacterium]